MSFNLDRLKHSTLTCSVASGGTERKQGNNISNMKSEYFIASAPKANRVFKIFSAFACIVIQNQATNKIIFTELVKVVRTKDLLYFTVTNE